MQQQPWAHISISQLNLILPCIRLGSLNPAAACRKMNEVMTDSQGKTGLVDFISIGYACPMMLCSTWKALLK